MTAPRRFFLTTAIDYPNSRPHIGTAFEKIGADVAGPLSPHGGLRRLLPDGQRREHGQGGPQGRGAEAGRPRRTATTWPASSARSGRPSTSATTTSSRPASRAITRAAASSSRRSTTTATSTRAATRAGTARAARSSRRRRRSRKRAASAPSTRRRPSGAVSRVISSPCRSFRSGCCSSTRRIPISSSRRAGATRSSAWSRRTCRTSTSRARARRGASASRSTRSSRSTSGSTPC